VPGGDSSDTSAEPSEPMSTGGEKWQARWTAQTLKNPLLKVEELVSGLNSPTTMAFIGPDDILVLQKNDGKVRRIIGGVLQPSHVHDFPVDSASERGLLGIAVHPQFPSTPFVYV
jgi:aldose sugar dehydrogenase